MSDLDNSNLTNEEENSGFSPSEPDNKSFSSEKGSSDNTAGNNDWGQTNYFQKPTHKMPLWPFLLVGAFVLLGIIAILTFSRTSYQSVTRSEYDNGKYHPKSQAHIFHRTQKILIDKNVIVEVHKKGISDDNKSKYDPHHYKTMVNCKPNDCKPGGKCDPKDCEPSGKCDPKDCEPGGKCNTNCCKSDGKYAPNSGKPIHHHSKYHKSKVINCEETSIKTVTPKPLRKRIYPKEGKPALQNSDKGLYVLQVYSALSKEDADAKYEELKSEGVEKVWVSTYTNSNVVWYRVRIGDFATKSAADAKARELGITTYWVDKIR